MLKTTCCFAENDVSFWWKRRVVLMKLTCRFVETDVSFFLLMAKGSGEAWKMECENPYNPPFSRVRVRAYIQEFLCFCCHKCHRFICKQLETRLLSYFFEHFLTVCQCIPSKSQCRTFEKRDFPPFFLLHSPPCFPHLSFRTSPSVWHLWQQKTQLRLERACLRVRVRISTAFCSASPLPCFFVFHIIPNRALYGVKVFIAK